MEGTPTLQGVWRSEARWYRPEAMRAVPTEVAGAPTGRPGGLPQDALSGEPRPHPQVPVGAILVGPRGPQGEVSTRSTVGAGAPRADAGEPPPLVGEEQLWADARRVGCT